jgi:hypothetical protein
MVRRLFRWLMGQRQGGTSAELARSVYRDAEADDLLAYLEAEIDVLLMRINRIGQRPGCQSDYQHR